MLFILLYMFLKNDISSYTIYLRKYYFDLAQTSSIGFNYGEYGGNTI